MTDTSEVKKKRKGPLPILVGYLIGSGALLGYWMFKAQTPNEKIVVMSLSVAILISFLVVYCVIYWIKSTEGKKFKGWAD